MKVTIEEKNSVIADFVDFPTKMLAGRITDNLSLSLGYHNSWDLLMSVVDKINSITIGSPEIKIGRRVELHYHVIGKLPEDEGENRYASFSLKDMTLIQAVHEACYQFIEWYNESK